MKTVAANTTDGTPIGLASSSALCGERLFLVDPRNAVVHEIRLSDGQRIKTFGHGGDPAGSLRSPESVIADCDGNSVVVQDGGSLLHYEMNSTAFIRRTKRAPTAGPALGFASMDGKAAVFPGYWVTDRAALSREPAHALNGFSIGYRVDLGDSGASTPLLPLITDGCRSMSSNCLDVGIDKLAESKGGWIACQGGGSPLVGVYSTSGELQRRVDTRSPLFLDDGTTAAASATVSSKIQWHQRNSAVRFCAAFDDYIVTVHYTLEPGEWSPGKAMPPRALMNIHGLDGTPISADIALRDVPVAKDGHNLYVLVYGESRKNSGGARLELDTIQITDENGNLNGQLRRLGG
ncbi:MAG: hypothetical protein Q7J25_08020 [Vicinamibacterales bacterium]|nr:hypothetical protein [Vicinamibacterales bacterium]